MRVSFLLLFLNENADEENRAEDKFKYFLMAMEYMGILLRKYSKIQHHFVTLIFNRFMSLYQERLLRRYKFL